MEIEDLGNREGWKYGWKIERWKDVLKIEDRKKDVRNEGIKVEWKLGNRKKDVRMDGR